MLRERVTPRRAALFLPQSPRGNARSLLPTYPLTPSASRRDLSREPQPLSRRFARDAVVLVLFFFRLRARMLIERFEKKGYKKISLLIFEVAWGFSPCTILP